MSEASAESGNPQRWWEGYLVRYFLGFIVGVICVIALGIQTFTTHAALFNSKTSIPVENQLFKVPELSFAPIAVTFALLGFAYCYIASSPITVLHSTRMMNTWFHRHSRSFWMAWALTLMLHFIFPGAYADYKGSLVFPCIGLLVSIAVLMALSRWSPTSSPGGRIKGRKLLCNIFVGTCAILFCLIIAKSHASISTLLTAFALPVMWILLGQYWTLFALLRDDDSQFIDFYKKISKARQKPGSRDIRESYTHLREHANSVFVVLIELCILAGLLVLRQLQPAFMNPGDPVALETAYWKSVLILTGIWLVPTVFMWSLANRLERRFSDSSGDFIEPPP